MWSCYRSLLVKAFHLWLITVLMKMALYNQLTEQFLTFSVSDLIRLLQNVSSIVDKNVVIQGDSIFNIILIWNQKECLKNLAFEKIYEWIKTLLKSQESCIMNDGKTKNNKCLFLVYSNLILFLLSK